LSSKTELQLLVQAAQKGNVSSFGKLYEQNYTAMVWLAYSILADRNLAEDAAQETFAVACQQLIRLKRPDKFASWLAGICRNVACQMVRDRKKVVATDDPPESAEYGSDNKLRQAVSEAISGLPVDYREALILRYYDGMNYDQMSSVLGIGRSKVKGRLFRARRKVRRCLKRRGFR
jgi:RNA polymerase sigma-70 factor (ECF subfamily)